MLLLAAISNAVTIKIMAPTIDVKSKIDVHSKLVLSDLVSYGKIGAGINVYDLSRFPHMYLKVKSMFPEIVFKALLTVKSRHIYTWTSTPHPHNHI